MNTAVTAVELGGLDLMVWLHTATDPSQKEWQLGLDLTREVKQRRGGMKSLRSLAISDGGAPNATQRGQMYELLGESHPLAVVTNTLTNPFKRGIVTAISWINPKFRAFRPAQGREALAHLGLTGRLAELGPTLDAMQARLPPIATLRELRAL